MEIGSSKKISKKEMVLGGGFGRKKTLKKSKEYRMGGVDCR